MSRLFSGTPLDRPITCPTCGKPVADCRCLTLPPKKKMHHPATPPKGYALTPHNADPPADQVARLRLEKRKGNRLVTLITGLEHPANDLPALCTALKTLLGTGGSVQQRTLELQGDHTTAAANFLAQRGLRTRIL